MSDDKNKSEVAMAQGLVKVAPAVLVATALGSCVAVCAYDRVNKLGGLVHIMLPDSRGVDGALDNPWRYADTGIDTLLSELMARGVKKDNLDVKIFGGADMFSEEGSNHEGIGSKIVRAVKIKLKEIGVKLQQESVGGHVGRTVRFDLSTGVVEVSSKM